MTKQRLGKQCVARAAELSNRILAASNALAGHTNEAQEAMAHLRELDPSLRVSNLTEVLPLRRLEDIAKVCRRAAKGRAARVSNSPLWPEADMTARHSTLPLWEVKRTWIKAGRTSGFDPKADNVRDRRRLEKTAVMV